MTLMTLIERVSLGYCLGLCLVQVEKSPRLRKALTVIMFQFSVRKRVVFVECVLTTSSDFTLIQRDQSSVRMCYGAKKGMLRIGQVREL